MKYFIDSEFIEDGKTIDLISIAIVPDVVPGDKQRQPLYLQNCECDFSKASDWVWRHVFPHLKDFNMRGQRSCNQQKMHSAGDKFTGQCHDTLACPWRMRFEIRDSILNFCNPEKYGKPEFWGYYADYDWVAFCQLFGTMIQLPKGFPMYCRDIKQLCDDKGNPNLSPPSEEHNALTDALWNFSSYHYLKNL